MNESTQTIDEAIAEARSVLEKGDVLPPALTRVAMVTMEIGDDEEAHAIAREVLALPSQQVMRRSIADIHNQTRTAERALEVTRKQIEKFLDDARLDPWS